MARYRAPVDRGDIEPFRGGSRMNADPCVLELLSYYRDAELHGATLLLRLMKMMGDDPEAQVNLTLHVAQETRHAWLWTKRIVDLGGRPMRIAAGYQARMGKRIIPHTVADLLALTIVVEARSLARYREHAARPGVDDATRRILRAVTADERWHLAWMTAKLDAMTDTPQLRARVTDLMDRYRRADDDVYQELLRHENAVFGTHA
jgi:bacterioferritin (cytochrome b1)